MWNKITFKKIISNYLIILNVILSQLLLFFLIIYKQIELSDDQLWDSQWA